MLGGLAPDGGLYLPEHYPKFTEDDLNHMRDMSYQDLAFSIFEKFIDDIPANDLRRLLIRPIAQKYFLMHEKSKARGYNSNLKLKR